MVDVAAEEAREGRRREELDVRASVVAASQAGLALMAGDVGLYGDAVARPKVRDGRVRGDDLPGGLVAEDVVRFDDHGTDVAGVPEMDIGTGGWLYQYAAEGCARKLSGGGS